MKKVLTLSVILASLAVVPAASASPILECGYNNISRYAAIANITTRNVDCGTGYGLATRIYKAGIRHDLHSFRWGAWSVRIRTIPFAGTVYYDVRSTASHGRVVHFQLYFE